MLDDQLKQNKKLRTERKPHVPKLRIVHTGGREVEMDVINHKGQHKSVTLSTALYQLHQFGKLTIDAASKNAFEHLKFILQNRPPDYLANKKIQTEVNLTDGRIYITIKQ